MSEWYTISNIDNFAEVARVLVYNLFGNQDTNNYNNNTNHKTIKDLKPKEAEELNRILTQSESVQIIKTFIKQKTNKKTGKIIYMLSDKIFANIIEELNMRMISNMLHKLANDGLLEIAYDSDINDFIFWAKDKNEDSNKKN